MKTLIFSTQKNLNTKFGNTLTTVFEKEGNIDDALTYFDGSGGFGSFFHNEEEGYYYDEAGRVLITDEDVASGEPQTVRGDINSFWTSKIDELTNEEIMAVINDDIDLVIQEVLAANGIDYNAYCVAKKFSDLDTLLNDRDVDYLNNNYTIEEYSDNEDAFYFCGKYYIKN